MAEKTREELIEELITTNHINALERRIFIASPIRFEEVLSAADKYFSRGQFIPKQVQSWDKDRFFFRRILSRKEQ